MVSGHQMKAINVIFVNCPFKEVQRQTYGPFVFFYYAMRLDLNIIGHRGAGVRKSIHDSIQYSKCLSVAIIRLNSLSFSCARSPANNTRLTFTDVCNVSLALVLHHITAMWLEMFFVAKVSHRERQMIMPKIHSYIDDLIGDVRTN